MRIYQERKGKRMNKIINIGESVNKESFNHATRSANTYQLYSNYYDVERAKSSRQCVENIVLTDTSNILA